MMPQRKEGEQAASDAKLHRLRIRHPDFDLRVLCCGKGRELTGSQLRALLLLSSWANYTRKPGMELGGDIFVSSSTVAAELGRLESDVRKDIRALVAAGLLIVRRPAHPRGAPTYSCAPIVNRTPGPSRSSSAPPPVLSGSFTGGQKRGGGSGRPGFDIPLKSADEKRREAEARLHSVKVRYQAHKAKCKEPRCRDCAGYERDIAAREGRS